LSHSPKKRAVIDTLRTYLSGNQLSPMVSIDKNPILPINKVYFILRGRVEGKVMKSQGSKSFHLVITLVAVTLFLCAPPKWRSRPSPGYDNYPGNAKACER
jgi:hypothetical protein